MPLTINTAAIVDGQAIDAADVTVPLNQIQTFVNGLETAVTAEVAGRTSAVSNLVNGVAGFEQLNVGVAGTVIPMVSDAITISRTRHIIDTQGLAAADDLVTINGSVPGDILILQAVSAARVITIRTSGNIYNQGNAEFLLDNPSKMWTGVYDGITGRWCQITMAQTLQMRGYVNTAPVATPTLTIPDGVLVTTGYGAPRLEFAPSIIAMNQFRVRGSGATIQADSMAAPTNVATTVLASSNQADTTYTNITSGAAAGNGGGFVSTFDLVQRRYSPKVEVLIRTPSTLTTLRMWIGLVTLAPTNVDDLVATVNGIGFRYSSVAGDIGWRGFLDDGTVQGLTADMDTVNPDTRYLLRVRVDGSGGGVAYFAVNNGPEVALSTGMPAAATNMGIAVVVFTNVAAARNLLFSRLRVEYD